MNTPYPAGFPIARDKQTGYPDRLRPQLKLALLYDCGCHKTLSVLEREAKAAGLTGAEIDAAISGRSFDARTAAVIAFACALKAGIPETVEATRASAIKLGITSEELSAVADEAKQILADRFP